MNNFKNILVVRTDRIGDVVLTTPAVRALRQAYPNARITMLIAPTTFDLVSGNPDIDVIILDDRKKVHNGVLGFWRLVFELRSKKFDLAINFYTKRRTNLLCFLAGVPMRVGYFDKNYGFLLTDPIEDNRAAGIKHEARYCLDVLERIGIYDDNLEYLLPLQGRAQVWARQFFENHDLGKKVPVFAIHPGASCPAKRWPVERFVALMENLHQKYLATFIMVGANDAHEATKQILVNTAFPVFDLTNKTTVGQLAGILSRCRLLVSNDSGPVHIADALDVPVVSIFTRNQPGINPERWRPVGPKSRYVAPPPYKDRAFAKSRFFDAKMLENVTVDEVLEAVDAIFKLC